MLIDGEGAPARKSIPPLISHRIVGGKEEGGGGETKAETFLVGRGAEAEMACFFFFLPLLRKRRSKNAKYSFSLEKKMLYGWSHSSALPVNNLKK